MSPDLYSEQEGKIAELENENRWLRASLTTLRADRKDICCYLRGCQHPECHATARVWARLKDIYRE